jgi:rhodanese-related sulfurtransferase
MKTIAPFLAMVTILVVLVASAQVPPTWEVLQTTLDARHPEVPWMTAADLAHRMASARPPTLLDARQPAEFEASHLRGARRIDPDAPELTGFREGELVVVYCSVGWRSGDVAAALRRRHIDARNLRGGIFGWANEGRPVEGAHAPRVHPFDDVWGALLVRDRRLPIR